MLHRALSGSELTTTDFRVPAFATWDLAGATVTETTSRGKHLLTRIDADEAWTLHTHLKMEGAWRVLDHGRRWPRPGHTARVVLETSEKVAIGFSLGVVEIVPRASEPDIVGHLGPDLLGPDWDADEAVRRLRTDPGRSVKEALLDQRNLAGIGNMYACELCFVFGVDPRTPVAAVPDLGRLVARAQQMLDQNRHRGMQSTTGVLTRGRNLWVYARGGLPCRRCGTRIAEIWLGPEGQERVTYSCPRCQPRADG
jgi:endonuclease-8